MVHDLGGALAAADHQHPGSCRTAWGLEVVVGVEDVGAKKPPCVRGDMRVSTDAQHEVARPPGGVGGVDVEALRGALDGADLLAEVDRTDPVGGPGVVLLELLAVDRAAGADQEAVDAPAGHQVVEEGVRIRRGGEADEVLPGRDLELRAREHEAGVPVHRGVALQHGEAEAGNLGGEGGEAEVGRAATHG